ncbi:uncharacterized protein LOC106758412 [Vigna radiata var. radiata]|uniref:Uncharacterized protein LOC106758412 n=1 Tax=Vigna radiata var. radiata TaxID=3916 RepID=A0A1S3TSS1_VIGRR|nr:uncharacterized protein LOC106758412 [Vigna radiata var. radiata]
MEATLGQTWDRYKSLLRKTHVHGFDDTVVVLSFLGGLGTQTKLMLDASAGGNIKQKTAEEAYELIESMVANDNETHSERGVLLQQKGRRPKKKSTTWAINSNTAKVSGLNNSTSRLEEMFEKIMLEQDSTIKHNEAGFRNFEMQISQLAKRLEDKADNQFRANIEVNPKEDCKAIVSVVEIPVYARRIKHYLGEKIDFDKKFNDEQGSCSDVLEKVSPPKVKDPGGFKVPCTIKSVKIGKALLDLGSSINMMPLFMLKKIGCLRLKQPKVSLIMADGSSKKPYGVVKDVVMRIRRLKFLVDFVVMEMKEDEKIPIILGRSFMKAAKVVINVDDGLIMMFLKIRRFKLRR